MHEPMQYLIYLEPGDDTHAWGVTVPDLPGCFSAGDTLEDALRNAREAIVLHLDGLRACGEPFPTPSSAQALRSRPELQSQYLALIDANTGINSARRSRWATR